MRRISIFPPCAFPNSRFPKVRQQTLLLSLKVVLPNGEVWNGLKRLRKDNTGYDLKQLFLGSEGTLGVITAAALRLVPALKRVETAFAAVNKLKQLYPRWWIAPGRWSGPACRRPPCRRGRRAFR